MGISEVNWNLKKPCADCPFKYDTAFHAGIAKSARDVALGIEHGNFAHTCHKTDVRSDCESAKGPVQHCAGMMIMAKKSDKITDPMLVAMREGKLNIDEIPDDPDVMTVRDFLIKQIRGMTENVKDISDATFNKAKTYTNGFQYKDRK